MDLFKKCYDFTRADEVKAAGFYPYFKALDAADAADREGTLNVTAMERLLGGLLAAQLYSVAKLAGVEDQGG